MRFIETKVIVHNRGTPPDSFLEELVIWGRSAPDELFTKNQHYDIYTSSFGSLGPWQGLHHRKAVMMEVLRVLAGFESSWDWLEGPDLNNPNSNTSCTKEAGIFQCSGNSMSIDPSLKELMLKTTGQTDCDTFREVSKSNHAFAFEYCATLLRFTIRHHGPIRYNHIHSWLSKTAVKEFQSLL